MSSVIIAIVGHHRGGTSAAAGALQQIGFYLGQPTTLMQGSPENPKGYFEALPLVAAHDRLLLALDRSWDDNRPLPDGWTDGVPYSQAKRAVGKYLNRLTCEADGAPVVVKDPRLARLMPLYRDVCWESDFNLRALIVDRGYSAVAASLLKRDGWDEESAWAFVVQQATHLREWEHRSAKVTFPDFVTRPLDLVGAVRRLLPGEFAYDERALNAFLDSELVHHG